MSPRDNETSKPGPLRAALVAQADDAPRLAAALRACPHFELTAQAGMDQADALPDIPWHDDQRVMIVQGSVDAVLLGADPRTGAELGGTALAHGVHVWRLPPMARSFAEAVETVRHLRDAPLVYRVASRWEHIGDAVTETLGHADGFVPLFSEIRVNAPGPSTRSWRASLADAPGGVLAADAYGCLEALVALRGLPERVFGATGRYRRHAGEALRETEDVATAILRYENGGLACLRAAWDALPAEQLTLHHGSDVSVWWDERKVGLRDLAGEALDESPLPTDFLEADIARFADSIRSAENRAKSQRTAYERHLAVTALLEAVYLSARTGQPESPEKFYSLQGWPEQER